MWYNFRRLAGTCDQIEVQQPKRAGRVAWFVSGLEMVGVRSLQAGD